MLAVHARALRDFYRREAQRHGRHDDPDPARRHPRRGERTAAKAVPGIEDVTISIAKGHPVVPLPEGSQYLGFIFSRAATQIEAEASLRRAHTLLEFMIR